MTKFVDDEDIRVERLLDARDKATQLFAEIETRGIIRPGVTEAETSDEIRDLAADLFGVDRHWHKRIVRAGRNTLAPYDENPPDLIVQNDDIVFLDLGPVFEKWEADFGRTFVVGNDPAKIKLRDDIEDAFREGKQYFKDHPEIRADELFAYCEEMARKRGWEFGGPIAGHLIGQFPHERIPQDKVSLYVHPKNNLRMRDTDANGQERFWILEIHFVDRAKEIGGFYEELLSVG